jgi:uncharacterized protein YxeA
MKATIYALTALILLIIGGILSGSAMVLGFFGDWIREKAEDLLES